MQMREWKAIKRAVSVVGFGGASISGEGGGYGFGEIEEREALHLLDRAKAYGVNLFDTAPVYGLGVSEKRIGKAFRGRRDEVILISKGGVIWDEAKRTKVDNRPSVLEAQLHQSLRDLQTERIDLYMVHWPDPQVDIRKAMEVLVRAKEAGKIQAIGLSNSYPEDIERALEIGEIAALQNEFHVFQPYPKESLFPMIQAKGMGFFGWGTFDKGILTGRVTAERSFSATDVRSREPWWLEADRGPKYKAMAAIQEMLKKSGHSSLEFALGYVLSHPEVTSALCGFRNLGQVETCLAALEHLPSKERLEEAEAIVRVSLRRS